LGFQHALVSDSCVEAHVFGGEIGYVLPFYKYKDDRKEALFDKLDSEEKTQNINKEFHKYLNNIYKIDTSQKRIFYYIYAILYSNTYRTKYAEFLKMDFPKIPFTQNYEVFSKVADLGEQLTDLHLMKSVELNTPVAKFPEEGNDIVEKIKYKDRKVFINKTQYFEGVGQEVYNYCIGGYKVCYKWLKSRKGRDLTLDDIKHYCRIVTAIKKTMEIQEEIDGIYKEVEVQVIDMNDYRNRS